MLFLNLLFFGSIFIIFYSYIGYGILVAFLVRVRRIFKGRRLPPVPASASDLPRVTLIISAYNEEIFIEEKIKNSLALEYP
jgi:biofilm PGA synthesis N-glycosyltransferase PgaC